MAVPEVFFVNVNLREGINTDQITSARKKLVSSEAFSVLNLHRKLNDCSIVTLCTVLFNTYSFCVTL